MKVLACGSRDWTDEAAIADALAEFAPEREVTVIHGDARGADRIAARIAALYGFDRRAFPADWDRYGKRAGILRNLQMLDEEPDLVVAFGEGRGTNHTVTEAQRRGIPVKRY